MSPIGLVSTSVIYYLKRFLFVCVVSSMSTSVLKAFINLDKYHLPGTIERKLSTDFFNGSVILIYRDIYVKIEIIPRRISYQSSVLSVLLVVGNY